MCYGVNMASPFDKAWSLIKGVFAFSNDDDDEDDGFESFAGKTEAEREEFRAAVRREWAKPEDEQFLNYHFESGPYWALDERQKKVADAALNLPPSFLKEEFNEMEGHFTHLFAEGHHEIPDHEFDRAEAIINNFGQQIETHEADPNSNQSLEFMQDFDNPNHPWTKAVESYTEYDVANSWQSKNASEPMKIAFQLLKDRQTILPIDGQEGYVDEKRNYIQRKPKPSDIEQPWLLLNQTYFNSPRGMISSSIKRPPLPKPTPSHIEWNPHLMQGSYNLRGEDGEMLSQIMPGGHFSPSDKRPEELAGMSSITPAAYRRQGYYDKLMRGLINAGVNIHSDERNEKSQGFHEEFQNRMTPNMKIEYGDETDGNHYQPLDYSRDPNFATFGDSDLAQRDYGAMPIYTASKPENRLRPNPIGSVQTSFPVIDDNFEKIKPLHSMNPIIPISSLMKNN